MKNFTLKKIALNTLLATASSVLFSPMASAFNLTFSIDGTFDDNATIQGKFDYDSVSNTYSNIQIDTSTGIITGANYTDSDFVTGESANGFVIGDSDTETILNLVFNPDLDSSFPVLDTINSYEEDFNLNEQRQINSGNIATSVPFNFTSSTGLLIIVGLMLLKKRSMVQKS